MGSDAPRKGTLSARGAIVVRAVRRAVKAAPARSVAGWRAARLVACAGAVHALFGCSSQAPACRSERCAPTPIEVMTWWPTAGSSPGASLREAAEEQPGVTVNLIEESTKDEMMARLEEVLDGAEGSPHVDAFLTHPGLDLLHWTPCVSDGPARVRLLNGSDGYADLAERFDPRVLQGLRCCPPGDDCAAPEIYGVPLGLHQVNYVVRNKQRFARCAQQAVTNVDSLVELLSCLGADGQRVITIPVTEFQGCQLGEGDCWKNQDVAGQSLQYLLESLSLLVSDPSIEQERWTGRCWERDSARTAVLLAGALEALDRLRPYLNRCSPGLCKPPPTSLEAALEEVASGDAALFIAPDWTQLTKPGQSLFAARGPFPGTEGTFLFTTDAFALPALASPADEAGLRWLDTLLQPEVQARFAKINAARPALTDPAGLRELLPSLELQAPVTIDTREIRRRLNEWAQGEFSGPPPQLSDLMVHAIQTALEKGLLPARAADNPACAP
ncbi:MAG TPA: hypothetical protein VFS67_12165 [Polyangiaceae bacterium]|nr:hypothetical protein [Polyangiaceae bacterium]